VAMVAAENFLLYDGKLSCRMLQRGREEQEERGGRRKGNAEKALSHLVPVYTRSLMQNP